MTRRRGSSAPSVALLIFACLSGRFASGSAAHAAEIEALSTPAVQTALARSATLMAVTRSGDRLVAVGERGIILVSGPDGAGWHQAHVPVQTNLTAVQFVTPLKGWAVGHMGVVLHTEDGGLTWIRQLDGKAAAALVLQQVNATPGSTPAAITDAKRLVADGPDKPLLDLYFENEASGFVVGAFGLIFHTADGGNTWQAWQGHLPNPRSLHLYGIRAAGGHIVIVGEQGLALRSDDHGASFAKISPPYTGTFFGAVATRSGRLFTYGLDGKLFSTDDAGATWRTVTDPGAATITAGAELPDGKIVFVDQGGGLLESADAGATYTRRDVASGAALTGIASVDGKHFVVTGLQGLLAVGGTMPNAG